MGAYRKAIIAGVVALCAGHIAYAQKPVTELVIGIGLPHSMLRAPAGSQAKLGESFLFGLSHYNRRGRLVVIRTTADVAFGNIKTSAAGVYKDDRKAYTLAMDAALRLYAAPRGTRELRVFAGAGARYIADYLGFGSTPVICVGDLPGSCDAFYAAERFDAGATAIIRTGLSASIEVLKARFRFDWAYEVSNPWGSPQHDFVIRGSVHTPDHAHIER